MNKPALRLLLLTYYWPPSGGAGVQRWLKFSKYLALQGIDITVVTPENPEYPSVDESLNQDIHPSIEVIKYPIWEPYSWYKKLIGKPEKEAINTGFLSESGSVNWKENLSRWIRGNFFIPDARKFWIKPTIKELNALLQNQSFDAIISTGPPHSLHLIAKEIKEKHDIKWIADFRDPWTNIDFYEELMLNARSNKKHHRLEKAVCEAADDLLVVGNTMRKEFEAITPNTPVHVIPNGYDPDDQTESTEDLDQNHFILSHIGSFSPARNVPILWDALAELCEEDMAFKKQLVIRSIGKTDASVHTSIEKYGLSKCLDIIDYVPHNQIVKYQQQSNLLLLPVNQTPNAKGILTGKVFEYLSANRPILAIGPEDGDLAHLMKQVNADPVIHWNKKEELKARVRKCFHEHQQGKHQALYRNVATFSRERLASQIASIIEK